jgi:hypothetical protein
MNEERLRKIQGLYKDTELRIKLVESRGDGRLTIPSINQLRNLSYHLLRYFLNGHNEEELNEAEHHCSRALFDTYELEALFYMKAFSVFQEEFSDIPISETVPSYLEWQQTHADIKHFITTHYQTDDRYKYYQEFTPYIEALIEIDRKLPHAREALVKRRMLDSRNRQLAHASIAVGVFGIFLAGLAWSFPDWAKSFFQHPKEQIQTKAANPPAMKK